MRPTIVLLLLAAVLTGCSSEPEKKEPAASAPAAKPEAPKNDFLTARSAFQKMYLTARGWAADARPVRMESQSTKEAPPAGKSGVWRAVFASAQRGAAKPFVWSGLTAPDAPPPGVNPGQEDDWSASNVNTQPFDPAFLKIDSDKAFEVAQQHGGEKLTKKDANQPVVFLLDWWPKENKLKWHVLYGTGQSDAKLRVAVDASTGDFLKVEK